MIKKSHGNLKKFTIILLVFTLLILPLSFAEGDYTLPNVEKHINVTDDGTTIISEDITYSVSGTINGVYRDVGLSGDQRLENISVETPGYYNTLEVINSSNKVKIKVHLYKDEAKTEKVSDEDVRVIYHYNFIKGVKIYDDIAELQYKSWGSDWDSDVDNLVTYIQIPGSHNNIEMWNNPQYIVKESTWTSDDTLKTQFKPLSSGQFAEQRILMPKEYFKSTQNADVIHKNAKAQIEQDQKEYQESQENHNILMKFLSLFAILGILSPIPIYIKYGREPKIEYNEKYEMDLPTKHSPVFVNTIIEGAIGETDEYGFQASLLDLIDKKYYKIISSNEDDVVLKQKDKDMSLLKQYEIDIVDYLSKFKDDEGHISLSSMDSVEFSKFMAAWKIDVNKEVNSLEVRKLFNNRGNQVASLVCALLLISGLIIIIYSSLTKGDYNNIALVLGVILTIESVIVFALPDTIFGQWTSEGKEFHDKWKNFEKYIKDYSLIKEYPPASIQVWGKYLVYATALGCASEASGNMKKYFKYINLPEEQYYESDAVFFSMYGGNMFMHSLLHDPDTSITDTGSFGDIGDVGGGFGGGGGGTF